MKNTENAVDQIKLTRTYYVDSVVKDVKKVDPNLSFHYNHEGVNGGITFANYYNSKFKYYF